MTQATNPTADPKDLRRFVAEVDMHAAIKRAMTELKLNGEVSIAFGDHVTVSWVGKPSKRDLHFDVFIGTAPNPAARFFSSAEQTPDAGPGTNETPSPTEPL